MTRSRAPHIRALSGLSVLVPRKMSVACPATPNSSKPWQTSSTTNTTGCWNGMGDSSTQMRQRSAASSTTSSALPKNGRQSHANQKQFRNPSDQEGTPAAFGGCLLPNRIITDKLRSYGAAKREVAPGLDHWSHKGFDNRAENSYLPFRKRERVMQGFRSPGTLQRFVSMQSATHNSFSVPARHRSALTIRSKHSRSGNPRHMPLDQRSAWQLKKSAS
jgi:hypothetical protein